MRKLFILLLISALFTLAACGEEQINLDGTQESHETTIAATTTTVTIATVTAPEAEVIIDYIYPSFSDYGEYVSYVNENNLPQYLISGDFILIGELSSIVLNPYAFDGKYYVTFHFKDESGSGVMLSIVYGESIDDEIAAASIENVREYNMRCLIEYAKGGYVHGDLLYTYRGITLGSIKWQKNGAVYTLTAGDPSYKEYPVNIDTFVSRLLDLDTAAAALEELMAQTENTKPNVFDEE